MDGWSGHLLIAPAWMLDPNFAHTVVLLLQHDPHGAFGLVLNKPTQTRVKDLWKEAVGKPCRLDAPVFLGGPVPGPLIALHDREESADRPALDGLYVTTDADRLAGLLADPPKALRVYAGYSGWGEEQLERELQDAAWVTTPAHVEDVFRHPPEEVWHDALRRATEVVPKPLFSPDPGPAPRPDRN